MEFLQGTSLSCRVNEHCFRKADTQHEYSYVAPPSIYATCNTKLIATLYENCGPGSSVGIATGYGLDGPEIESR